MDESYDMSGKKDLPKFRKCYPSANGIRGTVCQLERWTMQKDKNHETMMFGMNDLKGYDLSSTGIIDSSLYAYKKYHNAMDFTKFNPFLSSGQIEQSSVALPVCHSQSNVITDFTKNEDWKKYHRYYPFSCGDWRSNETRVFSDLIQMRSGSRNGEVDQETASETYHKILQLVRLLPNAFLGDTW